MKDLQKSVSKNKGIMLTVAEESIGNVRTVKSIANEEEEISKFDKSNIEVQNFGFQKTYWSSGFSFLQQIFLYGAMTIVIKVAVILYG